MALKVELLVNGPFQENCYLLYDDESKAGAFFDPGCEAERLLRTAGFLGITIEAIYNTHGHIDHAGAVAEVAQATGAPFALHPDDRFLLDAMPGQAQMFGLPPVRVPAVDRDLAGGEEIFVGGHRARVIHTPGHTPGGVCFLFDDFVIVGDTLFEGSIGRTDLPGGSTEQLLLSIRDGLLVLDDGMRVLCGHGPATLIGEERRYNPFLRTVHAVR
ncbi:MAG TPA: MBL fold metallo-hydrolase [Polyangia bacterium]|nr:MBL fold metallo-hydrolase [Polyangia bacterium]